MGEIKLTGGAGVVVMGGVVVLTFENGATNCGVVSMSFELSACSAGVYGGRVVVVRLGMINYSTHKPN